MPTISYCEQYPTIDILPTNKGVFFDDQTKILYYTKAAYIKDEGYLFDLVKFERDPIVISKTEISEHDSMVAVSFNFSANDSKTIITVLLNSTGKNQFYIDGIMFLNLSDVTSYMGSDERGWYWGVRFIIPYTMLEKIYGTLSVAPGDTVKGNIYAFQTKGDLAHFVSVAPFMTVDMDSCENHSDFTIV